VELKILSVNIGQQPNVIVKLLFYYKRTMTTDLAATTKIITERLGVTKLPWL
jgi:hypothetical protein